MVTGCIGLFLTLLAFADPGCNGLDHDGEALHNEDIVLPPWWGPLLGLRQIEPRSLRADKEERFWATRGKRGINIKPNGLFQAIKGKRSLKPNGLFGLHSGKRSSFKPNSLFALTAGKRSSFKPNSLFSMTVGKRSSFKPNSLFSLQTGKRNYMKPNGLFPGMLGKRNIVLKPNGLFSLTKRSIGPEEDDVNSEMSSSTDPVSYYNTAHWGIPNGLFGAYKRAMKPNGLFSLKKKSMKPNGLFSLSKKSVSEDSSDLNEDLYEYYYDNNEDDTDGAIDESAEEEDELEIEGPEKRDGGNFWATRGKKDDNTFWATRGKKSGDFWAVRG